MEDGPEAPGVVCRRSAASAVLYPRTYLRTTALRWLNERLARAVRRSRRCSGAESRATASLASGTRRRRSRRTRLKAVAYTQPSGRSISRTRFPVETRPTIASWATSSASSRGEHTRRIAPPGAHTPVHKTRRTPRRQSRHHPLGLTIEEEPSAERNVTAVTDNLPVLVKISGGGRPSSAPPRSHRPCDARQRRPSRGRRRPRCVPSPRRHR